MRRVTTWKITAALTGLLMLSGPAARLNGEDAGTPGESVSREPYRISDAERLQVSQLEAAIWRSLYMVGQQRKGLAEALAGLERKCEASGGAFQADPNQPAAATCVKEGQSDEARKPENEHDGEGGGAP